MRILLALALFAAACGGSKKSAQAPAAAPPGEPAPTEEGELQDEAKPDDPDDPVNESAADPCDGGE